MRCLVRAADTLVSVSAKSRGATALYRSKCLQLLIADTRLVVFEIMPALGADDVGHFDGRSRHRRECLPVANNLHRLKNYSKAKTAASAAPAASFLPATGTLSTTSCQFPHCPRFAHNRSYRW